MSALERWAPFRDLEMMEQRMRRLFPTITIAPVFTPAADVYETKDELVIELEVPGYEQEQLDVEVGDHTLTISGQREADVEKSEKTLHLHERLEARFKRSFHLPAEADGQHLRATYGNGILTLQIPKVAEAKPTKVPIAKV
jgi:HSP20 family protein